MRDIHSGDVPPLRSLGFDPGWAEAAGPWTRHGSHPARVVRVDRGVWLAAGAFGTVSAVMRSREGLPDDSPERWPAVGDWIMISDPGSESSTNMSSLWFIDAVLPRRSAMVRADPGRAAVSQVLAANVDVVFVVHGLLEPPKPRRLEREVVTAWDGGASPVVVFTKLDLCDDPAPHLSAAAGGAPGVPCHLVSGATGEGVAQLLQYLGTADEGGVRTGIAIGPSGAGKSTLINRLLGGERLRTGEVRASDGKGRHTTVSRELVALPTGGALIDTPGLRALALSGGEEGLVEAFADVEELAALCRFRDCSHDGEPGCAVRAAVEEGLLAPERLQSYRALSRELRFQARKEDVHLRREERRKWRIINKAFRNDQKARGKRV